MNENQVSNLETQQSEQGKTKSFSMNFLTILFAFASLSLLVLAEIILNFRPNHMNLIRGLMSIPIYVLPVVGMVLSFWNTKGKKPAFDFWLNVGTLIGALRFL